MDSGLESLVVAAQSGSVDAFGRLVSRFQDAAFASACGLLRDRGLAEEAAQDAFVEAFFSLPSLRTPAAFPGWFRVIVHRCCGRLRQDPQVRLVSLDGVAPVSVQVADPAESHELEVFVREAIFGLPEGERVVTNLYYLAGYSQVEIAGFLGLSAGMVKKRLRQARERLRKRMMAAVQGHLESTRPSRDHRFAERVRDSLLFFCAGGKSLYSGCSGSRLYRMKPDGTGLDPLTDPGTFEAMDWFPDGKRLLLARGRIVKGMPFVRHCTMGLDGSEVQAFGLEQYLGHSRISPDGSRIAFTSNKDHPTLYFAFASPSPGTRGHGTTAGGICG